MEYCAYLQDFIQFFEEVWGWLDRNTATFLSAILSALIGGGFAIFGVKFGHRLALSHEERRGDALETAMYSELAVISDDLAYWLKMLLDENEKPARPYVSKFPEFDYHFINAVIVELAAVNRLITPEQRKLVVRLSTKLNSIIRVAEARSESSKLDDSKKLLIVPSNLTRELIFNVVETIFYIQKFIQEKRSFVISEKAGFSEISEIVCETLKIEYAPKFWSQLQSDFSPQG